MSRSRSRRLSRALLGGFGLGAVVLPLGLSGSAWAVDPTCRVVEVRFQPQGFPKQGSTSGREELSPQVAVWVESADRSFRKDLFLTRAVGLFGIGNRPGLATLKSHFRWPYGRRPSALPVWAHRRGKTYGFVVMGGRCSSIYNPDMPTQSSCRPDFAGESSDDDRTIAYHFPVSSDEPYFCSPSGKKSQTIGGVDVVSCASSFYGSKGWYAPGYTSVYPPRADLKVQGLSDHGDVLRFGNDNDVAAISAATPQNGKVVDPPVRWYTTGDTPDGDYVMWVEANIEGDFNAYYPPGQCKPDRHAEWDHLGQDYIGQPSVVYQVPFRLDQNGRVATVIDYSGYGDRLGQSGTVNPPDGTISVSGGSGADRFRRVTDENGDWRVKVSVAPCDPTSCETPLAPAALELTDLTDATITVRFPVPDGPPAASYQVRYQLGTPITDQNWDRALPAPSANLGPPGSKVSARIVGLAARTKYYVAVRPVNRCGIAGPLLTGETETQNPNFYTLSGCFVATAAYGTDLAPEVAMLRQFRDKALLQSPLGRLAVASYYSLSPSLAAVISESEELRELSRSALRPVLSVARTLLRQPSGPPSR
jgi:hypothetical protein